MTEFVPTKYSVNIQAMDIKYINVAHYGNVGGTHSLQPQYMLKGNSVYGTRYNKTLPTNKPVFTVRGGKWYSTEFHPDGKSEHATYEMRGDKIHTTVFHPEHNPSQHVFEMRSNLH